MNIYVVYFAEFTTEPAEYLAFHSRARAITYLADHIPDPLPEPEAFDDPAEYEQFRDALFGEAADVRAHLDTTTDVVTAFVPMDETSLEGWVRTVSYVAPTDRAEDAGSWIYVLFAADDTDEESWYGGPPLIQAFETAHQAAEKVFELFGFAPEVDQPGVATVEDVAAQLLRPDGWVHMSLSWPGNYIGVGWVGRVPIVDEPEG